MLILGWPCAVGVQFDDVPPAAADAVATTTDESGAAAGDADFAGGGDRVRYRVPVAAGGPYRVDVELRYQPIAYRWAHNLERYDAREPARFVEYYRRDAADSAVTVATVSVSSR